MILNAVIPGGVWVEEWGLGGQSSRQRDEPVEGPQGVGDCGQHKAEGSAVGMEREGDRGEWASDETASSVEIWAPDRHPSASCAAAATGYGVHVGPFCALQLPMRPPGTAHQSLLPSHLMPTDQEPYAACTFVFIFAPASPLAFINCSLMFLFCLHLYVVRCKE